MQIFHRNSFVGNFLNTASDMWYLEGDFESEGTEGSELFLNKIVNLDLKSCMADPTNGIRLILKESENDEGTLFVAMSYENGRLFGRRVFDDEAKEYTLQNVPE